MTDLPDLPQAPIWRKLAALVYDSLILAAISMAYGGVALTVKVNLMNYTLAEGEKASLGLPGFIGWLLVLLLFYCFFWLRGGQTIGMRAWRLRLVTADYTALTLQHCLIRATVGPLSLAFIGLGYWWQLIDREHCSWHDRASQTRVLVLPKR